MIKRVLALMIVLSAIGLGAGCGSLERDTMTVQLTWPSGDCDLGMIDPYGNPYWIDISPGMPSGTFSADRQNGGTETWSLNYYHPTGLYTPQVYSDNTFGYTGSISLTVAINGNRVYAYEPISPGEILTFMDFEVTRADGGPSYKVVRTYVGERPE